MKLGVMTVVTGGVVVTIVTIAWEVLFVVVLTSDFVLRVCVCILRVCVCIYMLPGRCIATPEAPLQ